MRFSACGAASVLLLLFVTGGRMARADGAALICRPETRGSPRLWLAPGLGGFVGWPEEGILAELSAVYWTGEPAWPTCAGSVGLGGLAQVEADRHDDRRVVAAGEVLDVPFGLELGMAVDAAAAGHATTESLHIAPFVSFGYVSAALRVDVPFAHTGPGAPWGAHVGLEILYKLPLPLGRCSSPYQDWPFCWD